MGKAQNVKSWDKVLAPLMAVSVTFPLFIAAGTRSPLWVVTCIPAMAQYRWLYIDYSWLHHWWLCFGSEQFLL